MSLTDTKIRNAKPKDKPYKLYDATWRIPAERMKMKDPHIVPLSKQAIAILRELQQHSGNREHVFPNSNNPSKCMSENTMLFAL